MKTFIEYLNEHVLSIGMNPEHEKYREQHRSEMHDMIRSAYKPIGGYGGLGHGTKEESDAIHHDITHSLIKATKRDGHITSVNLYKAQHGRKSIASATNGTDQGKKDFLKAKTEDHTQKRAWGEVSGAVEHIHKKMGVPAIPASHAKKLLGKDVEPHDDKEHYDRMIGGHKHTKIMMGHPKVDK